MRYVRTALAAAGARALHDVTPLVRSAPLSAKLGAEVFLKMDCFQPSGSFKLRGIGAAVKELVDAGADGVVSSSGGNAGLAPCGNQTSLCAAWSGRVPEHLSEILAKFEVCYGAGLATAHAARALGVACTVVLPTTTPASVKAKLESEHFRRADIDGSPRPRRR